MTDPAQGLREQIRVARLGGIVSAIACFCHHDGLPNYRGRYPLPGNLRIDELEHKLWRVWRRAIRPELLGVDHDVPNLDLLWHFKAAGLQDLQINGHLKLISPGDVRIPIREAVAHAKARYRKSLEMLTSRQAEYGDRLQAAGFGPAEFNELIDLTKARFEYLQQNPKSVREVMEVFVDPLLIVRGTKVN